LLNEESHIHPRKTHLYLKAKKKSSHVVFSSATESLKLAYALLLLVDMLGIVAEVCLTKAMDGHRFTHLLNDMRLPDPKRPSIEIILKLRSKLFKNLRKTPNKAPEPTPGPVTPRAPSSKSK
jgi:hypothetical protein